MPTSSKSPCVSSPSHPPEQTWARKSAKLLAAIALLATTSFGATAAEQSYTITFKNGDSNNGSAITTTTQTSTLCDEGAEYLASVASANNASIGLYGLKLGTNGGNGSIKFNVATKGQQIPTKVEIQISANKNASTRVFEFNGNTFKCPENTYKNDKYYTCVVNSFTGNLTTIELKKSATSGEGWVFVKTIKVYYAGSTELGEIMYGSEAANNKELSGFKGDVFTFSADNAENMTITVDPANTGVVSSFENGSISWTAPAVEEETPVMLTVKATKGAAEKEATVMVTINKAPLCTMPPVFTPGVGTITKGSTVTITCENAKQIKYWISENADDAEADAQTVDAPAKVTINQNCYLHACGINADGIAGETSSVQYTVTEPTTAEFDFTNAESINAAEGSTGIEASNGQNDTSKNNLDCKSLTKNGITLSFSVGANAYGNKPRWWEKVASQGGGTELRIYTDNTLTVTAENGKKLSKITMNGKVAMTASAGTISNGVWTPSASVQTIARAEGDITSVILTPTSTCNISSIAVDYATSTPTGIAGIEAEDGEAVYFNLQGVRVQNPENGIFIRVQNGKAVKIMK